MPRSNDDLDCGNKGVFGLDSYNNIGFNNPNDRTNTAKTDRIVLKNSDDFDILESKCNPNLTSIMEKSENNLSINRGEINLEPSIILDILPIEELQYRKSQNTNPNVTKKKSLFMPDSQNSISKNHQNKNFRSLRNHTITDLSGFDNCNDGDEMMFMGFDEVSEYLNVHLKENSFQKKEYFKDETQKIRDLIIVDRRDLDMHPRKRTNLSLEIKDKKFSNNYLGNRSSFDKKSLQYYENKKKSNPNPRKVSSWTQNACDDLSYENTFCDNENKSAETPEFVTMKDVSQLIRTNDNRMSNLGSEMNPNYDTNFLIKSGFTDSMSNNILQNTSKKIYAEQTQHLVPRVNIEELNNTKQSSSLNNGYSLLLVKFIDRKLPLISDYQMLLIDALKNLQTQAKNELNNNTKKNNNSFPRPLTSTVQKDSFNSAEKKNITENYDKSYSKSDENYYNSDQKSKLQANDDSDCNSQNSMNPNNNLQNPKDSNDYNIIPNHTFKQSINNNQLNFNSKLNSNQVSPKKDVDSQESNKISIKELITVKKDDGEIIRLSIISFRTKTLKKGLSTKNFWQLFLTNYIMSAMNFSVAANWKHNLIRLKFTINDQTLAMLYLVGICGMTSAVIFVYLLNKVLKIRYILMIIITGMIILGFTIRFLAQSIWGLGIFNFLFFLSNASQMILIPSLTKQVFGLEQAIKIYPYMYFGNYLAILTQWVVEFVVVTDFIYVMNIYSAINIAGFFVLIFSDDKVDWSKQKN